MPLVPSIKTKDEAMQYAINWQNWANQEDLSNQELSQYNDYFYKLAEKFNLIDEFTENGII